MEIVIKLSDVEVSGLVDNEELRRHIQQVVGDALLDAPLDSERALINYKLEVFVRRSADKA